MSRVLADILGARNPEFSFGLRKLESIAGLPRADIRLMLDVQQKARDKIMMLGFDPKATTGAELYHALEKKLLDDEQTVRKVLGLNFASTEIEMLDSIQDYLKKETGNRKVFVVKQMVLRSILKKLKPKATMKILGYRSMDSMFKHESIIQLLAATEMIENDAWHRARLEAYKKLKSFDFELRSIQIVTPSGKKWPDIARNFTQSHHHAIITVRELGGIILLPTTVNLPAITILTTLLGLRAANEIRSLSSILKLQQVRNDFGEIVVQNIKNEAMCDFELIGQKLPWSLLHWFYDSRHATFHPEMFEPHLQKDDFYRHDTHLALSKMHQTLSFWRDSTSLAFLEGSNPVSLNILDVALGVCNKLTFAHRAVHHMRESLSRELMAYYLNAEQVQIRLADIIGTQLVPQYEFENNPTLVDELR